MSARAPQRRTSARRAPAEVLACRHLLAPDLTWIEDGAVVVARGRVVELCRGRAAARRAVRRWGPERDLGEFALAPGLIDAHAHLELSALCGEIAPGTTFGAWVREVIARRAVRTLDELARGARRGIARLLETGTTTVGDIDSTGAGERALARGPLRSVLHREVLDAYDEQRTAQALARVSRALPRRALQSEGLAPHAPFTASPALLAAVARIAARRRAHVTVHWSETREELAWLTRGSGPLARFLGTSPRASGLDLLERAGLLGPDTSLVHGNHPAPGELARIAASGATVVHCPGSHRWFGRTPFAWSRYRSAGVPVALGTDSWASNQDLDMRREMALARRTQRALAPGDVWRAATTSAAAALGLAGQVGALVPGAHADFVLHALDARRPSEFLDELTAGGGRVAGVWVAGLPVDSRRA